MTDFIGDLSFKFQYFVTWLMTLVLVILAAITLIGILLFAARRKLNKYMFVGFVLFIVCRLIFTKFFGYQMEIFRVNWATIWVLYSVYTGS